MSQIVIPYLPYEARLHPEDGRASDGIGSRAPGDILYAHCLQCLPYLVARLHVDMLHAALRKMELPQHGIIRKHGKDIRQGIAHT